MQVWTDLFVGPVETVLEPQQLRTLLHDLVSQQIVRRPWGLVVGEIEPSSPVLMAGIARGESAIEGIRVVARGTDWTALWAAWDEASLGEVNFCVWFGGLDWDNPAMVAPFEQLHGVYRRKEGLKSDVLLFGLVQPHPILIVDTKQGQWHEVRLQQYLTVSALGGPCGVAHTPLEVVLQRHFGANLLVACGRS